MSKCAFCGIAESVERGEADWVLGLGGDVISFVPYGKVNSGHRMFVPIEHVAGAGENPVLTARCFEEAAKWGANKGLPFNLVVNSGKAAGQSVFHLHVHYVPRVPGDGLGYRWKPEVSS